jgi:hypothetical protein
MLARVPGVWRLVAGAAGVALVAAAAVVVGPGLVSNPDPGRPAARPAATAPPVAADAPVRGDLASDLAFLRQVLGTVRAQHPDADRVLYAASLPDGGRVAFVGRDRVEPPGTRALDVYAIRVLPGEPVRSGTVTVVGRGLVESTALMGWAGRGTDGSVYAALLSASGPLVGQVSPGIDYFPDGSAFRQWRDVRSPDGSLVVDLGPQTDPALFARSRASPAEVPIMMVLHGEQTTDPRTFELTGVGTGYAGPPPDLLADAVLDGCRHLFDLRNASVRVIWSGRIGRGQDGALLRVRRADGSAFQLLVGDSGGRQLFVHGPLRIPWEVADVLPWLFESGDPSRPLVLINPTGPGTASVSYPEEPPRVVRVGRAGTALFGVGAPASPNLYRALVEVRSPKGEVVVKAPLTTVSSQDPFLLDL